MDNDKYYYFYFLESIKNGKIYVGYTSKPPILRLKEHNESSNTWSSQNGPFTLKYYEKYFCKQDAINREKFYKSGIGKKIKSAIVKVM